MRPTVAARRPTPSPFCRQRTADAAPPASRTLAAWTFASVSPTAPVRSAFESSQTAAEVEKVVATALDSDAKFIKLTDDKGKVYIVPTASFSYLEVGTEQSRRVGFVA